MPQQKPLQTIITHIATWGVLFLLPMMFRNLEYPEILVPSASVMGVFYMNYSWLTPRYYMHGKKTLIWVVNAILIVVLTAALHLWLDLRWGYVFNLAVAVMISVSMRLGSLWQEAQEVQLEAETALARAELSNLQYQTNPHFLLNTLNNIYALTTFDVPRAQTAIQQLSVMLRHILYDSQEQDVDISDEVKFLENYISLMKIRLSDAVDITFDVTVNDANTRIAPLILIPLVENAFKHGVSPTQPSYIHISLKADKRRITFDIENSNFPKSNADHSGHGIGLVQVQRRLDLSYSGRYQWTHGPSADGTTYCSRIVITINNQTD